MRTLRNGHKRSTFLSVFIVQKTDNSLMKRINPLLTDNNPAPIPGCHTPVQTVAHSGVVLEPKSSKAKTRTVQ
jgi:hypothetical protein